jgi:hypothetical protein
MSRHFLNRLRDRLEPRQCKNQRLTLSLLELDNLRLWLQFLNQARAGISMNLLTHRSPTNIRISDSCPYGMGGFTWRGTAWRLRIPEGSAMYGNHTVNNALEFLAMAVTIWLMILEADGPLECFLGLGDSMSAIGWLFRSSSLRGNSIYTQAVALIARKLTTLLIEWHHALFAQHLQGALNVVADQLSFTH